MDGDDEVKHYGVKGMRWGVRRAPKKQERYASMSNAELQRTITRLSLEKRMSDLERDMRSSATKQALADVGTTTMSRLLKSGAMLGLGIAISGKAPNRHEVATRLTK